MKQRLYIFVFLLAIVSVPMVMHAAAYPQGPLIPCGQNGPDCDFNGLMQLGVNIVNALFIFSIPIVALVFAYAGWLYLSAMGDTGKVKEARKIFTSVLMGFLFMLVAWLLVKFIQDNLLDTKFKDNIPKEVQLGS